MAPLMREWLGGPSRIAMLLGAGALSIAVARADTVNQPPIDDADALLPQHSAKPFADLIIWQEDGRVFLAEAGQPAEELRLGNTAEADWLCQQLQQHGATADKPHVIGDRIILVGGGGCGFDWAPPGKTSPAPHARAADQPTAGTPPTAQQRTAPSTSPNTTASGYPGKTPSYR